MSQIHVTIYSSVPVCASYSVLERHTQHTVTGVQYMMGSPSGTAV